jgi:hypothetical protein
MQAQGADEVIELLDQLGDRRLAAVQMFPREVLVDAPRQPVVGTNDDLKRLAQVVPGHRQESDVKLVGAPEVMGDLLAVHDTLGLAHGYTCTLPIRRHFDKLLQSELHCLDGYQICARRGYPAYA